MTRRPSISPLLAASALLVAPSSAQDFSYTFDAASSDLSVVTAVSLDLTGGLRGVFDAATNPGGTRTILGILGDPGTNADVPLSLRLLLDLNLGGAIDGDFGLSLNEGLGTVVVEGLAGTVGAGSSQAVGLNLELMYDTFRTANPGALYLGGFPLTLPLGDATITDVTLAQVGPGAGAAAQGGAPGLFDIDALVPVELSFMLDLGALGGGGGPMAVGPLPLVLPIDGTLDVADCDTRLVSVTSTAINQSLPSPFPLNLTDVPLDLPTILPPGQTASLLLSAMLDTVTIAGSVDTAIEAMAIDGRFLTTCAPAANSSGVGASLGASGSASVTTADLTFAAADLPMNSLGYLLMSRDSDRVPGFGGSQGTLCLGGTLYRFSASVQDSGLLGQVSFSPDFASLPSNQTFAGGETWYFQYWFRDANPQPTSNTTSGLRVLFCR